LLKQPDNQKLTNDRKGPILAPPIAVYREVGVKARGALDSEPLHDSETGAVDQREP
jgi:hypothetical protein